MLTASWSPSNLGSLKVESTRLLEESHPRRLGTKLLSITSILISSLRCALETLKSSSMGSPNNGRLRVAGQSTSKARAKRPRCCEASFRGYAGMTATTSYVSGSTTTTSSPTRKYRYPRHCGSTSTIGDGNGSGRILIRSRGMCAPTLGSTLMSLREIRGALLSWMTVLRILVRCSD
jgi:hypothetical protein